MQKLIIKIFSAFRENFLLIAIISLALFLRLINLSYLPPSLNWDEVSHGYNAYSILKTGKDEWGVTMPTIFRAYGDYKLPVYIYLTAVSEFFLGLNEVAVRLPSVLAGTLSVVFTYLLAVALTKKKSVAALSAFLLAVEPWGLFLSRVAVEANLALAFIIAGVYFFLKGLNNSKYILLSFLLFGLSVWTYNAARIFVPLLIVALVLIYRLELKKVYRKRKTAIRYSLIVVLFFFLPMFWQLFNPQGLARYGQVAILDQGAIAQINEARTTSNLPFSFAVLAHNKATFFVKRFALNYFSHFSPDYLFFKGGSHYQLNVPGKGLLFSLNLPFFLIGLLILAFESKNSQTSRLIASWFLLAPVASSLTREAPHVLRSIVFLPTPQIIVALGLVGSYFYIRKKWKNTALLFVGLYALLLFAQFESYAEKALFVYRENYSWSWQYGYKEIVNYAKENYDKYDKIIVTKKYAEPHEFILFYWPWDPAEYRSDPNLNRFYQSNWYWVDSFDKFYFVNDWQINEEGTGEYEFNLESKKKVDCTNMRCLLIIGPGNVPSGWSKVDSVNFLNFEPAFEIYEN